MSCNNNCFHSRQRLDYLKILIACVNYLFSKEPVRIFNLGDGVIIRNPNAREQLARQFRIEPQQIFAENQCPICLQEIQHVNRAVLPCGHCGCFTCLHSAISFYNRCPICNRPFNNIH